MRHDPNAAFAHYRLDDDGGGFRPDRLAGRVEIGKGTWSNPAAAGPKPSRYFLFPAAASVASVRPWNAPSKVTMRYRSGLPEAD